MSPRTTAVVAYLAELSYPLYMSHFMFTGVFRTWVKSLAETSSTASIVLASVATYLAFVAIAALMMRFWDRPIQRLLSSRSK